MMIRYFIMIRSGSKEWLYHPICYDYERAFKYAMEKAREHGGRIAICRVAKEQKEVEQ